MHFNYSCDILYLGMCVSDQDIKSKCTVSFYTLISSVLELKFQGIPWWSSDWYFVLSLLSVQVQSQIRELRSHKLHCAAKREKRNQISNSLNPEPYYLGVITLWHLSREKSSI